jgi:predicted DNA-binding ArsR family transcriptional regulator
LNSDLVERWNSDEEELFFEVIGNDAVRLALKKQTRRRMIETKWYSREIQLLRQMLV